MYGHTYFGAVWGVTNDTIHFSIFIKRIFEKLVMSFVNLQMAEQLSITYVAAYNPHLHVWYFTSNNQRIQKFHVHVPIKIKLNNLFPRMK